MTDARPLAEKSVDAPGAAPGAGPRARAERRDAAAGADRRRGGEKPANVPVERRRKDRRSGPRRTAGLELSPGGLSLAITVRDGAGRGGSGRGGSGRTGAAAPEPADPDRKSTSFYGTDGFDRFTEGAKTICRFRPWPAGCGPTEPGFSREVLAEVFAAAASDLGAAGGSLGGVPIEIALGGSLCVTRVLTASHEEADREAAALADRAGRYLGLGRGEKTCVTAEERLDARTRRVRVTVAPRRVAADVLHVLNDAGLRAGRIEHTLATLSAGLHARGCDGDRPVLLMAAEGDRLDVAVAHRGRLLLDYRPVGHRSVASDTAASDTAASDTAAGGGAREPGTPATPGGEALLRHQKRLRRYVANQLRGQPGGAQFFAEAEAAEAAATGLAAEMRAYVTGGSEVTARLIAELDPRPDLAVGPHPAPGGVDFAAATSEQAAGNERESATAVWSVGGAVSPGPLAAVLLACGAAAGGEVDPSSLTTRGDLSVAVRPGGGVPWAELAKVGWPLAASLALTVGLWGAAWSAAAGNAPQQTALDAARADARFADRLEAQLDAAREWDRRTERLAAVRGTGPVWVPALAGAGAAVAGDRTDQANRANGGAPRRAWIEEFSVAPLPDEADPAGPARAPRAVDERGAAEVAVVGGGHTEADVFYFAERLRGSGRFARVQLAGTREARYRTGPGVRFELTAAPKAPAVPLAAARPAPDRTRSADVPPASPAQAIRR